MLFLLPDFLLIRYIRSSGPSMKLTYRSLPLGGDCRIQLKVYGCTSTIFEHLAFMVLKRGFSRIFYSVAIVLPYSARLESLCEGATISTGSLVSLLGLLTGLGKSNADSCV